MASPSETTPALFDGHRLRQARLFRGMRKVDVARQIGVTPAAVGQFERGKARPSPGSLAAISLHLGFPRAFFEWRGPSERLKEGDTHFRSLRSTSKLDRDRMLARLELLGEILGAIQARVKLPAVNIPSLPPSQGEGASHENLIEETASKVRTEWGLGNGPLDDVVRLLEAHGVIVVRPRIESGRVDAFSAWVHDRPVVVLASDKDDRGRSRFDAAHELGHLVMHHDAHPGNHAVELEAQRFAAAFLMPATTFAREFPGRLSWPVLFRLKERWQVSLQSLLYRGRTLGLLSPDAYRRAQVRIAKEGWRTREPLDLGPPEMPSVLRRSLDLIEQELGMNRSDLAAETRLAPQVFDELIREIAPPERAKISLVKAN